MDYNMYMYLTGFNCTVSGGNESSLYNILYKGKTSIGCITYEVVKLSGKNKPIVQDVMLLVKSEMGDIIDEINSISPLNEDDFNSLQMEIRTSSRDVLKKYLKNGISFLY